MQEKKEKEKMKESFSVKEIEEFTKKNRFLVAFGISFVLAALFSFFLSMMGLSLFGVTLGALIGIVAPQQVEKVVHKVFDFIERQEQTTQLVLAAVLLILSIFLPPLVFLLIGLHGGKDMRTTAQKPSK